MNIIKRIQKYEEYQRALAILVYKIFDKKTRSRARVNEELAEELHKPVKNLLMLIVLI